MSSHQTVLILDYGSQYTQLIARRVREQRVYCEILPFDADPAEIAARAPTALILIGWIGFALLEWRNPGTLGGCVARGCTGAACSGGA